MAIKVRRKTGWIGWLVALNIIIDGVKIKKIESDDEIQIDIPKEEVTLQVTHWGIKTEPVTVKDGETVEIYTTLWQRFKTLFLFGVFALNYVLSIRTDLSIPRYIWIGLIILLIMDIVVTNVKPGMDYNLRKVSAVNE